MNKPVYTTAAISDLDDVLKYAARDKPKAAIELVQKIEAKCLLIASSPAIGEAQPQLGLGVRSNLVGRYVIFHRHANDQAEILRVIPGDCDITQL